MIEDCIKEVKRAMKENPNELFTKLVYLRLEVALKAYYQDLSDKFNSLENQAITNAPRVLKKIM